MDQSLFINYCGFSDFSLKNMVVLVGKKAQMFRIIEIFLTSKVL